jgi:SAM-dependent MidA family methyltransferase
MRRLLARDFIFDRMCHQAGSFYARASEVGQLGKSMPFKEMIGKSDYLLALGKAYP